MEQLICTHGDREGVRTHKIRMTDIAEYVARGKEICRLAASSARATKRQRAADSPINRAATRLSALATPGDSPGAARECTGCNELDSVQQQPREATAIKDTKGQLATAKALGRKLFVEPVPLLSPLVSSEDLVISWPRNSAPSNRNVPICGFRPAPTRQTGLAVTV